MDYKYFVGYANWLTQHSISELVESWGVRLAILRFAIQPEFLMKYPRVYRTGEQQAAGWIASRCLIVRFADFLIPVP